MDRHGRWSAVAATAVTGVLVMTLAGCARNQVGSARNAGIYASKATMTAESALSAVSTVQMVAQAASDDRLFRPFAAVAVGQQEDAITEIAQTFRSIQPPDDESLALRDELGPMLDAARDHIAAVRITVRRGDLADAAEVAAPLAVDAAQLEAFAEEHE
jgi:hypothetical protein